MCSNNTSSEEECGSDIYEDQPNMGKSKKRIQFIVLEKFSLKKLNAAQKRKLNRQIYAEAEWKIDKGNCVRARNCNGEYTNDNLCMKCQQLRSNEKLVNRVRVKKPDEKKFKVYSNT
nr:10182_t:CDS:2 [Entrophospora candida]